MLSSETGETTDLAPPTSRVPVAAARSMIAALYDPAVLMTVDFAVLDYNRPYLEMTGLRNRRLREHLERGVSAFDLVCETKDQDRAAAVTCIREKKGVHLAEREVQNAHGQKILAWMSFVPVLDEKGEVVAVIEILRDVSGDAQAQAKLKALLAQMKTRADDLESAVERRTAELSAALEDVTRLSRTDPLTGLLNRRAFSDAAVQLVALAKRHERCCAILMCDLDHFKRINDEHGHQAGDQVLQAAAATLGANIRESDLVARFGGEEFVILLAETSREAVMDIAQRLNRLLRNVPLSGVVPAVAQPQTISIGVALFPEHGTNLDQLLTAADSAMYAAKQNGRDQSVLYDVSLAMEIKAASWVGKRVLLIEGDFVGGEARARELAKLYDVVFAPTASFALTLASHGEFDVVICDEQVQGEEGLEILRETLKTLPGALRILMVETEDFHFAVRATNDAGVDRFLLRSEAVERLVGAIEEGQARREMIRARMIAERSSLRSAQIAGARVVRAIVASRSMDFWFQPIVEALTGRCVGYEALCRPRSSPSVRPEELFEAAVRSGDIWRLGRLGREILASKISRLPQDATLFINLHPAEIDDPLLLGDRDPLGAFSSRIVLEITERASIIDFASFRERLAALKAGGYRVAIDDLGAGYASLSSVALLEPDFLKIDMSLIRGVKRDTPRYGLMKRIVDFANDHALRVVSEGIETAEEASSAREIGSHLLQGYLFGRPVPLE